VLRQSINRKFGLGPPAGSQRDLTSTLTLCATRPFHKRGLVVPKRNFERCRVNIRLDLFTLPNCLRPTERRIEHPQDVRGFVRDDRPLLLVPQTGTVTRDVHRGSADDRSDEACAFRSRYPESPFGPGSNVQPSSPISQCTTDMPTVPASPLRLRMMSVQCATKASDT